MATSDPHDVVAETTRTSQIIVGALVAGLIVFLGIVLFLNRNPRDPNRPRPEASPPLLLGMACVFAGLAIPLSVIAPRIVTAGAEEDRPGEADPHQRSRGGADRGGTHRRGGDGRRTPAGASLPDPAHHRVGRDPGGGLLR